MLDPLTAIAVAVLVLTAVSMVLARVIPDEYGFVETRKLPRRPR